MRYDLEKEIEVFDFSSKEIMVEELQAKNLGYDFEKGKHTITMKTNIDKVKQYYIADKLSRNLGDISKVERLPYADMVTYSFCCQDLSCAGKGEGMKLKCDQCEHSWLVDFEHPENNNTCPSCGNINIASTRSGLLNQVQRLLGVAHIEGTLPKYLLLENVKNLIGKKFKPQFDSWVAWLESIGYNTYYQVLNAKHYGIPQNRERVFAISIRKDVDINGYTFPETIPLTHRLKDVLEKNVDEKYYLPDERIEKILNSTLTRNCEKPHDIQERFFRQVAETISENECKPGDTIDAFNKKVNKTGVSPTITTRPEGFKTAILPVVEEPFVVASRGRNPENPSDRTVGAPTEQRLEPNFSGCTNTLTSVQKDNYVCEPQVVIGSMQANAYVGNGEISPSLTAAMGMGGGQIPMVGYVEPQIIQNPHGFNKGSMQEDCPAITSSYFQENNFVVEPIIYDNYNSRISADQDAINTLTCNCGASAERNGVKIIEPVIIEDFYQSREPRVYEQGAPTLRSERTGLKVVDGDIEYPCSTRCNQVASAIRASIYKQGARNLEQNVVNGLGYEGVIEREEPQIRWRIRKLTEKECWRLMNFTDQDHDRAAQFTSASARYKQAGNSIVVACLVALFSSLFIDSGHKADVWSKYLIHYSDKN